MSLEDLTREGADVIARCEVLLDGVHVDSPAVKGGAVTFDTDRRVLRDCDVTVLGSLPGPATRCLLRLFRGARDWTGEEFFQPVGVYALDASRVERRSSQATKIPGYDFSALVSDARWRGPYVTGTGAPEDILRTALKTRLPLLTDDDFNFAVTGHTITSRVWGEERDNDPWEDFQDVAASVGMLLYFDREGRPTLEHVPDPNTAALSWSFVAGEEPTYLDGMRESSGRAYNIVDVRGEPEDLPVVTASAEDDNPSSPSYVGVYQKNYNLTSGYIETTAQAQQAANGELRRQLLRGSGELVEIKCVPIPTLDVWRVVRLADPRLSVDSVYSAQRMALPLIPGEMTMAGRRRLSHV